MTTATKPTTAELHDLYIEQGLSQPAIGALYGVSRFTVRHWVNLAGIERPKPGKKTTDPKRNSWLDADGEAPPLRPNVTVKPGAHQQYVIDERRPARVHPLDAPATAEQLAEAAAILTTTKALREPGDLRTGTSGGSAATQGAPGVAMNEIYGVLFVLTIIVIITLVLPQGRI